MRPDEMLLELEGLRKDLHLYWEYELRRLRGREDQVGYAGDLLRRLDTLLRQHVSDVVGDGSVTPAGLVHHGWFVLGDGAQDDPARAERCPVSPHRLPRMVSGMFVEAFLALGCPPQAVLAEYGTRRIGGLLKELRDGDQALRYLVLVTACEGAGVRLPLGLPLGQAVPLNIREYLDLVDALLHQHADWEKSIRKAGLQKEHLKSGAIKATPLEWRLYNLLHPFFPASGHRQNVSNIARPLAQCPRHLMEFLATSSAVRFPRHHRARTRQSVKTSLHYHLD